MDRLTSEEKVLLHLSMHRRFDEDSYLFPADLSQEGISQATGIARKHLPRIVKRLIGDEMLKESKGRIEGARQRLKVYLLTPKGISEAERIEKYVAGIEVSLPLPDGKRTCKYSEINGILGIDRPISYWALKIAKDGTVAEMPKASRAKREGLIAYKRALTSVMSDGTITPIEQDMLSHLRGLLEISDEDAERAYKELLTRDDIEPPIRLDVYEDVLKQIVEDAQITEDERAVLDLLKKKLGISDTLHDEVMRRVLEDAELASVKERQSIADVFLIYRDGRLIAHLTRRSGEKTAPDSDLVAGMLTAIQSFMDDLFKDITAGDIEELRYSGYYFVIETGQFASLAVSSKSRLSEYSRNRIKTCLNKIESQFKDCLDKWEGDMGSMEPLIEGLISEFQINHRAEK